MSVLGRALTEWDRETFIALNHGLKNPAFDFLMPLVTDIGLGHVQAVVVLLLAVYLGFRAGEIRQGSVRPGIFGAITSRKSWVAPLVLTYAFAGRTATALKTIQRERPWWFSEHQHEKGRNTDVKVLTVEGVYPLKVRGFPSGHTATTVGMATVLTMLSFRRRYAIGIAIGVWALAGIVALSRIYLASHWPLDILGGGIIGIISGVVSVWICGRWADSRLKPVGEAV